MVMDPYQPNFHCWEKNFSMKCRAALLKLPLGGFWRGLNTNYFEHARKNFQSRGEFGLIVISRSSLNKLNDF
jgi:hypothetical protein